MWPLQSELAEHPVELNEIRTGGSLLKNCYQVLQCRSAAVLKLKVNVRTGFINSSTGIEQQHRSTAERQNLVKQQHVISQ